MPPGDHITTIVPPQGASQVICTPDFYSDVGANALLVPGASNRLQVAVRAGFVSGGGYAYCTVK
jgi:hypothetical protein